MRTTRILLALTILLGLSTPVSARRGYVPHHGADVWADLAHCESAHGSTSTNVYQFATGTWRSLGLPGRAGFYSGDFQLAAAQALDRRSGPGQWPACGRAIHLTRADADAFPPGP